ncbi:LacI family transcriptional regulator [Micromonospora sp. DR5-3]|uniref:LacI family DNA-binding transcriptional regulator n=1 Tax=unclassified Micromonospora TaxID=2617518 RepID=UPI0011D81CE1|nr:MULTISPECIES: LacI family DNA-binding transcriptional regulator [unclassified Micromonospora]MCW3816421.1 LacI family transcriptional regulator [Micromonospora sp. DR5-3]TYC21524.1 LacI family transcriptional regulator [Micromonospora sp. MP36]
MTSGRRVRLVDVAREAGTSVSTVSRVLNGSEQISFEVRNHVRSVAARLGYRADGAAKELKLGRVRTVGVTVPDLANPFFPEVLKGLGAGARGAGYRLLISESGEDPDEELRLAEELTSHASALVLCSSRLRPKHLTKILDGPIPVVCVNRTAEQAGVVCVDYRSGSRQLLDHLATLGHRRIAYVGGPPASWSDGQRRRTLRTLTRKMGMRLEEITGGWSGDHGYAAGPEVLATGATAVITFNDLVAIGLLSWLHDTGVEVPGAVSVTSYDDIPVAAYARPPLTSLRNQRAQLGRLAWGHLSARLAGDQWPPPVMLTPTLTVRASTGRPPADGGPDTR